MQKFGQCDLRVCKPPRQPWVESKAVAVLARASRKLLQANGWTVHTGSQLLKKPRDTARRPLQNSGQKQPWNGCLEIDPN